MKEEDLIKKIERIELPEVELSGHRHKLRRFLMSRHSIEQKRGEVFSFLRPVLVGGFAFAILLAVILNASFFTRPSLALAKEIALQDSRVRSLIDRGAIIKETELADNKGYLLVQLTESRPAPASAEGSVFFSAKERGSLSPFGPNQAVFLIEVDFKGKKVSDLKEIPNPLLSFSQAEEEAIKEISQQSDAVRKMIPFEAKIKEIQPVYSQLKLVNKGSRVEVKPEKEAVIIYKQNNKEWQGKINLGSSRVEKIEFLGEGDQ